MKKLSMFLCLMCLTAALTVPASAAGPLTYTIDAPDDPDYGVPTSFEPVATANGGARKNEDISKNAALIPPGFGTASADTLNTGTPLTPNLAPDSRPATGAAVNGTSAPAFVPGSTIPDNPSVSTPSTSVPSTGYTEVTSDLYYSGGHLGTLKIPAIGLSVKVYQGTDSATLMKGAGHFEDTSIWDGNVAFAGVRPDRA